MLVVFITLISINTLILISLHFLLVGLFSAFKVDAVDVRKYVKGLLRPKLSIKTCSLHLAVVVNTNF